MVKEITNKQAKRQLRQKDHTQMDRQRSCDNRQKKKKSRIQTGTYKIRAA